MQVGSTTAGFRPPSADRPCPWRRSGPRLLVDGKALTVTDDLTDPFLVSRRTRLRSVVSYFGLPSVFFAVALGVAGGFLAADPGNDGSVAAVLLIQTLTLP